MVHVAVGVVLNGRREVLIALRDVNSHQGGLWEFPGGKLEPEESVQAALARELREEVHIEVESSSPLRRIRHDYGDKQVLLDVRLVEAFTGEPAGNEGQPLRWVPVTELHRFDFPRANDPIIELLQALYGGDPPEGYA